MPQVKVVQSTTKDMLEKKEKKTCLNEQMRFWFWSLQCIELFFLPAVVLKKLVKTGCNGVLLAFVTLALNIH